MSQFGECSAGRVVVGDSSDELLDWPLPRGRFQGEGFLRGGVCGGGDGVGSNRYYPVRVQRTGRSRPIAWVESLSFAIRGLTLAV